MSFENSFPLFLRVRGGVCRLFILCALSTVFMAADAAQAFAQRRSAPAVARLISSSEDSPAVSIPARTRVWAAPAAAAAIAPAAAMSVSGIERRAFDLVNAERAKLGQAPLAWDAELCRMAELHSQHMAQQNFFSHIGPDGMNMEARARALGMQNWRVLGENIAYNRGFADPAAFAVQRWMNSEGHRANILNAKFNRSAIGVVRAADGRIYLTQVFLSR